ncbi:unnamed protein product [Blepharisma stoltei]|uniref:PPM-type phosphatase domain-containing protein n=1 Tax=Blepharisma stoltei TaxID=1481888 RepID=A0AAU9JH60_9CILI|nr:unnamed protein product [Blepharisma stoltei]
MGSCLKCAKSENSNNNTISILNYPRNRVLEVIQWNKQGEAEDLIEKRIELTNPKIVLAREIIHKNRRYFISVCTLPGLKAETFAPKVCQDHCLVAEDSSSILMAIHDGHGSEGEKVSSFVSNELENYYRTHKQEFANSPKQSLILATKHCDEALYQSGISITYSGTTQVIALIQNNEVYFANVGDSRALIASGSSRPATACYSNDEWGSILEDLKKARKYPNAYPIKPFQLTTDHKPDSDTEIMRILENGGCIKRKSNNGVKSGPHRIYKLTENAPGLATSRTLGDRIARQIGVICDPEITFHTFDFEQDEFIVMASDGLWDVMSNEEVVNFVAAYKENCQKEVVQPSISEANSSNSCIAQLLCEEARLRWLKISAYKKTNVDDITCIVLDLNKDNNGSFTMETSAEKSDNKVMPEMSPHTPHADRQKEILYKHVMNYAPFEAGRCP